MFNRFTSFKRLSSYRHIIFAVVFIVSILTNAEAACSDPSRELNLVMFRPANGVWYEQSGECSFAAVRLGERGDVIVPADYDGDKIVDMSVWNPLTGSWTIRSSSNGKLTKHVLGAADTKQTMSNTPVPADYDGDGRADIAVWHSGSGEWSILGSVTDYAISEMRTVRWGGTGDLPVPADYDGDGRADLAVVRTSDNTWSILESKSGNSTGIIFGAAGEDILVPADYTGDGKADIAVFRNGSWLIRESESGESAAYIFGTATSFPVPADYDGDGKVDLAAYDDGKWLIELSSGAGIDGMEFGNAGDVPISFISARNIYPPTE